MQEENAKQIEIMRQNFKTLRERRHRSFEELSQTSGISTEILTAIECGEDFGVREFLKLCRFYGVTRLADIFYPMD